jgi:hypothetical protein
MNQRIDIKHYYEVENVRFVKLFQYKGYSTTNL